MSKNRNYKKGNVLILVMAAMLILSILGMAKLTIARIDATEAIRLKEKETAFSLAQQGFNEFKALVNDDDNLFKFQTLGLVPYNGTNTVFDETVPDPLYPGRPPGTYTVSLEHATYTNGFFQDVNGYKVTATGHYAGKAARITCFVRTTTIAEQVWGTGTEGGVWFVTGDILHGSIHSNGKFYIDGTPVITGGAKTHAQTTQYDDLGNTAFVKTNVFRGGLTYNVPSLEFDPALITSMRNRAAVIYPNNSVIVFKGDLFTVKSGSTTITNRISQLGIGGKEDDNIIYVDGTVTVSGNVGGYVSVLASDTILINAAGGYNGIVYDSKKNNPNPSNWGTAVPDADEGLGLFAVSKVMIIGTSDRTPVNVHAVVYVPTDNGQTLRGFCVQKYDVYYHKPYINFYGCLIQARRGVVGQTSGNGFLKNYWQDLRFMKTPPPGTFVAAPEFYGWNAEFFHE